ncbi:MAG: anti-sigma F factor antagonist [Bacillota bacterium]
MEVNTERVGQSLLVRINGELDHHTADQVRNIIDYELDKEIAKNVVLNLKGLTFMDSSGLGVIMGRYRRVTQNGGKLVACQINPQIRRVFDLSGLPRILTVYKNEADALDQL